MSSAPEVVVNVVEGLKSQPALLALIVLNVIILGVIYMSVKERNAQQHAVSIEMLERCFPEGTGPR